MTHTVIVYGRVEKVVKRGGERFAVLADLHSYSRFLIPDRGYVVGQTVGFEGQIAAIERSGLIRLMGLPKPPAGYD